MQVNGSASVAAPLARVWDALQDPAVLARTIPGCRSLEETGPGAYRMTVSAGVASVQGTYVGRVELADPDPPRAFTLRAQGQGAPGTVDATVRVRLSDGGGSTRVDYDADAVVGGMIGGVGQRMLGSVARRTAGDFFAAVERDLVAPPAPPAPPAPAGPAPEPSASPAAASDAQAPGGTSAAAPPASATPPGGETGTGRVYPGRAATEPAPPTAAAGAPTVAAFLAGGAVALAGVALGHLLAVRGRGARTGPPRRPAR